MDRKMTLEIEEDSGVSVPVSLIQHQWVFHVLFLSLLLLLNLVFNL